MGLPQLPTSGRTEMVIPGPPRPPAPADLPRVDSRLTNGLRNYRVSTQKALSFAKNGNRSGKAALLTDLGREEETAISNYL